MTSLLVLDMKGGNSKEKHRSARAWKAGRLIDAKPSRPQAPPADSGALRLSTFLYVLYRKTGRLPLADRWRVDRVGATSVLQSRALPSC